MKWWRRLFCRHAGALVFVRNIYGDEINHSGGMRSLWRCECGSLVARKLLIGEEEPDDILMCTDVSS